MLFRSKAHDFADAAVKRGFTSTGKGDVIQFRLCFQKIHQFSSDLFQRKELPAFQGEVVSYLNLAIDTAQWTVFERNQVHAEGISQSTGMDRAEKMFVFHSEGGAKLEMRLPSAFVKVVGIVESDQAKGALDADTRPHALLELEEIEIAKLVVAIAGVKKTSPMIWSLPMG